MRRGRLWEEEIQGDDQEFSFGCAQFEISFRYACLKIREIYGSGIQERGLSWKCHFGSF